ncbi:MAG: potassium channel protein [Gemmataceae bacterium]|nr:potassium channel protein [Gemmataceae bacterium]
MKAGYPWRYAVLASVPAILLVVGTLGYWLIEKEYTLFDSFYMTVITLTTVGYGETHPLSTAGRWFTIFLLLGGVFSLFYAATEIVRAVVSGEVQEQLGRRRMERALAGLAGHVIVCGYGRMGRFVCREFSRQGVRFVVIDRDPSLLADFGVAGGMAIVGDATSDETLKRAGVDRARGLVTVAPHDADNLYITMSARLLNAKLHIVARAEGEGAEAKLARAGADRVVSPYALGGSQIAQAVTRPTVLDFIELAMRTEHLELQLEQVRVEEGSTLAGKSLAESKVRADLGLIVVAIKKAGGELVQTPTPETRLEEQDILIALGRRDRLVQLEKLAAGTPKA